MRVKPLHLIINPAAGRGSAAKKIPLIEAFLSDRKIPFQIVTTSKPDEGKFLASQAPEDVTVVACGGDGTISQVVNGLRNRENPIGILSIGSGNDFIKSLGIPPEWDKALEVILRGDVVQVDLGQINDKIFTNSVAFGIDGHVATTMDKAKWLHPKLSYHFGVILAVFSYKNKVVRWRTPEDSGEWVSNLTSIMNGRIYGGGYHIAPPADIMDGKLDLISIGDYGILGRIRHLPKIKKGTHLGVDRVFHTAVTEITLDCDEQVPLAIDGELVPVEGDSLHLEIKILPKALSVFV